MRTLTMAATLALLPLPAHADVDFPVESPAARLSQRVGLTEIALEYSSPAVRGRRVFGGLVPYDRPWSISPDQAATIRFSKDVVFAGKPVAGGTYRFSAVPGKEKWTVVLSRSAGTDAATPIQVKVPAKPCAHRERLTFFFSDFTEDRTSLDLEWEKVRVSVPIAVNTTQQVVAGISGLDSTWKSYANAARYMLETKKDFDAGLKYANQSLALKEDWYTVWIKAALLAAKGDYDGACYHGELAYQLGQKLGDGFVLEGELKRALAEWNARRELARR